jgi:hypothetical protein
MCMTTHFSCANVAVQDCRVCEALCDGVFAILYPHHDIQDCQHPNSDKDDPPRGSVSSSQACLAARMYDRSTAFILVW